MGPHIGCYLRKFLKGDTANVSNVSELDSINAELALRELARRRYREYLPYVHGSAWKTTRMSRYLADNVQDFLETDTGHAYDILVIETPPQHGKLLADDTPVLTSAGWKRHGDLRVGDYVYNHKGEKVKVTHIHPKHYANREVTLTNGEKIQCHENHEWLVYDRNNRREHVVETKYLEQRNVQQGGREHRRGHRYNFQLPRRVPILGDKKALAVEPYVLGVWLGDGTNTKCHICACKADLITLDECRRFYPRGSEWVHKDTGVITRSYLGLTQDLRQYGMCYSDHKTEKYIPDDYLTASREQRLELLAGLIDTDGYVDRKHRRVVFTTADVKLRRTFEELIATFGWRTTTCEFKPCVSTSGIIGRHPYWQIAFNPTEYIPCRIERKQLREYSKPRRVSICDIRKIEPVSGNCITVEGGIYLVGRSMVPTHNSLTITETLPSWYMGRWPDKRVIIASYNEDFAEKFCRRNKEKIKSKGDALFNIHIGAVDRAVEFELAGHTGRLISRGIRSGITGNPANLVIIDDPVKNREEADSETFRSKVWEEWQNSIKSRLAAGAKVIIIMTPWHEDDLAARVLANEHNARLLRLPVEAEEDDPLGRSAGDPLCPELGKDAAWLADFKASYIADPLGGARAWSALYQCSPRIEGGNLVLREWWRYYDTKEILAFGTELISVDAAFKGTDSSDYVAITVWGKRGNDYYLRYCLNRQMSFTETLRSIRLVKQLYPLAQRVLIEDKANGSAIIDVLQREMFCIPVTPRGGKEARVNAVSPAIESGHVYLPMDAPWLETYIDQWAAFPAGAHDDMVDSSTQALAFMLFSSGQYELPPIPEEVAMADREQEAFLDGDQLYDVYDQRNGML